jgi:hypothetical protein
VRVSFRGIEVLKRGFSPRVLSAYVLGSKGRTAVSGARLASAFGLYDTWAYFSVQSGHTVRAEPDRSGSEPPAPTPTPAPAPAPAASPQGGSTAPAGSTSPTGGASAG